MKQDPNTHPQELVAIALEYANKTLTLPSLDWSNLEKTWCLICRHPQESELSFTVRRNKYSVMVYFLSESYAGSYSDDWQWNGLAEAMNKLNQLYQGFNAFDDEYEPIDHDNPMVRELRHSSFQKA